MGKALGTDTVGFYFLSDFRSRRVIRTLTLFVYFLMFQALVLLQKPFLQFDFIVIFYAVFGVLFGHHLLQHISVSSQSEPNGRHQLFSYLFDFLILIVFMKYFPYLSSFILVLQLFLLFVASFDLDYFELSVLGFISSIGASMANLSSHQSSSVQSILSLTLFNLSYLSVIVISRQLKTEFFTLQTDLSQTRRKWRSQEEFLKSLIEKLPLGLAVTHANQEFALQNSYFSKELNLAPERVQQLIALYNSGSASDIVSDSRIFNFDKSSYFDEEISETLDLYLVKDVTEIRVMENQFKQREKLAAVGQLAAGIAHEIRNPLAGISGSIQMLSQDSSDPTQKKLMEIVLREIDRLNLLITEFLDYAKPEKVPDAEINLKQVLEDVLLSTRRHPELSADFQWRTELSDVVILGFPEKLKQAFLNIIINSIQAMKGTEKAAIEVKLFQENGRAVLSIRDYGSGMTEETRKKMFEPFHTTKPKGTGLGLAITHKILDLHRAGIEVRSEVGKGTEFIIKFPLAKGFPEEKK